MAGSWTVCCGVVRAVAIFCPAITPTTAQNLIDDDARSAMLAAMTQSRTQVTRKPLTRACVLVHYYLENVFEAQPIISLGKFSKRLLRHASSSSPNRRQADCGCFTRLTEPSSPNRHRRICGS